MSNHMLDDAKRDMQNAARKAEDLRRQYNQAVADFKAKKERWRKLDEARVLGLAELEQARRRALAAGNVELARLLVPR